ncbi:MAG TPA: sigma 54-interacting transcriptional regulator [Polyangiaceae bacterium]|jgi:two-component system nitrogen regulation response regulator GlnG|nr:sigma 54-interacting transcriptional regulator [Polyangiaceae bacterium]
MTYTNATTQKRASDRPRPGRATVPCLTLLAHVDARRIGERTVLPQLLVGQSVGVSRLEPSFAAVASGSPLRPLNDTYLSRKAICTLAGTPNGGVQLEPGAGDVTVDGERLGAPRVCTREELSRGLVLALGDRAAVLLHLTTNPAQFPLPGVLGASDAIAAVREEITRLADTLVPILIRGETGAGKECVARAIHDLGPRAKREWVAVNMAAMAESIAVATLFGHAKGAFTGAQGRHQGVFERASGGTLFLDEIGETPESVQPMLLRTLETGRILSVGDEAERELDVRVIAATDANLEREVATGSFRAALLHRLAGYEVQIPALRERRDDIARLFVHFLDTELRQLGDALLVEPASPDELKLPVNVVVRMVLHPLPGNVRQLRNIARTAAIANRGAASIVIGDGLERLLAPAAPTQRSEGNAAPLDAPIDVQKRPAELTEEQVLAALEQHGWSPGRTAASLGLATSTLHDLLRRLGIRRAADLSEAELRDAESKFGGDFGTMARSLRVSERALRLVFGARKGR